MRKTIVWRSSASLLLAASLGACGKGDDALPKTGAGPAPQTQAEAAAATAAHAVGVVTSIDLEGRSVTISHDPIPEIGWSAMTMAFAAEPAIDVSSIKAGDNLHFMLKPDGAGGYRLAMACRIEGDVAAHKAAMKSMMEKSKGETPIVGMTAGVIKPCTP